MTNAGFFQLNSPEELVELSIIAGNDFTAPYLRGRLRGRFGLTGKRVVDAARWVNEYRRVENHPAIKQEMVRGRIFFFCYLSLFLISYVFKYYLFMISCTLLEDQGTCPDEVLDSC